MEAFFHTSRSSSVYPIHDNGHFGVTCSYESVRISWKETYRGEIKTDYSKRKTAANTFIYYPILSLVMLVPTIVSVTLLYLYFIENIVTINPILLLWVVVAFGGLYAVLLSATREINHAKNKHI